jgi:hypothetical protein
VKVGLPVDAEARLGKCALSAIAPIASGHALRARTKQMLGEFYCYLSVPVDELEDLGDRLHRFTAPAGPSTSTPIRALV